MISRRNFLSLSAALPAVHTSMFAGKVEPLADKVEAAEAPSQQARLYIGTGSSGPGKGILTASWDARTGEIGPITLAAEVISPTFLATHRLSTGETLLFAVSEVSGADATVSAFTTVPGSGALKLLNRVSTGGDGPTHLSVSRDGRTVLVANYGSGSVSSFLVGADGSLSEAVSHFQFKGSGPYKGRQEGPHTHSAVTSPDGRFALVNDLGLDRIMIFHLDSATAKLTPNEPPFWTARPGSGPRHLAWNPNGRMVYCSNELDSTVDALAWSERPAGLHAQEVISSLPKGFPPNTAFVGEIIASADGRNVYAANRVADHTIAVFDVDRQSGLLSMVETAPSGGKNSRHIALDPTDRWMVVSHQDSNDLTILARDPQTGRLSGPKHAYPATKPMCVVFV